MKFKTNSFNYASRFLNRKFPARYARPCKREDHPKKRARPLARACTPPARAAGLSQAQIAAKMGVLKRAYGVWEC